MCLHNSEVHRSQARSRDLGFCPFSQHVELRHERSISCGRFLAGCCSLFSGLKWRHQSLSPVDHDWISMGSPPSLGRRAVGIKRQSTAVRRHNHGIMLPVSARRSDPQFFVPDGCWFVQGTCHVQQPCTQAYIPGSPAWALSQTPGSLESFNLTSD